MPSSEALPEIFSWMPLDAALTWRYNPAEGFLVTGFGNRRLSPAAFQQPLAQGDDSWVSRGLLLDTMRCATAASASCVLMDL